MRRSLLGIVLILFGLGALLQTAFGYDVSQLVAQWWPVLLILFGLLGYVQPRSRQHSLWSGVLIIIGTVLLLRTLNLIQIDLERLIWPLFLVAAGFSLLVRAERKAPASAECLVNIFTAFGGHERRVTSNAFEGGSVMGLFGGVKLDLSKAGFADGATLHVTTAFGGVEISVPVGCKVTVSGLPLFGGITDESMPGDHATSHLAIDAFALFGGISIKN